VKRYFRQPPTSPMTRAQILPGMPSGPGALFGFILRTASPISYAVTSQPSLHSGIRSERGKSTAPPAPPGKSLNHPPEEARGQGLRGRRRPRPQFFEDHSIRATPRILIQGGEQLLPGLGPTDGSAEGMPGFPILPPRLLNTGLATVPPSHTSLKSASGPDRGVARFAISSVHQYADLLPHPFLTLGIEASQAPQRAPRSLDANSSTPFPSHAKESSPQTHSEACIETIRRSGFSWVRDHLRSSRVSGWTDVGRPN